MRKKSKIKEYVCSYAMLFPNLVLFLLLSVFPIVWTMKFMFYRYSGFGASEPVFVGLDNLIRVFRDEIYWKTVKNTWIYAAGKIVIIIPAAFILAYILSKPKKINGFLQTVIFVPTIMSAAVMGMVFYLLFNAYNGQINTYLQNLGVIETNINWFSKDHAMLTLILIAIWGGIGNYMIYFISGLTQISEEVMESAQIDGANRLQTIWYITLPMLGPVLKIIMMIAITNAFSDYTSIMVLTEGGPQNSTMVMALYGYRYFFSVSAASTQVPQYGYGASIGAVSALLAGIVTLLYLKFSEKLDDFGS